jgi:hypothetical protein
MTARLALGALLLTATAAVTGAQTGARWLDQPLTAWNQPGFSVASAPMTLDAQAALDKRCGTPKSASPVALDAIRRARWVPFLHLDQAIARNGIEVIGGMTGATPGCGPESFNLFVFLDGVFAGTVSPVMMTPSRDGAAGAVRITGTTTLTVEFARYAPNDSACCPSSRVRVSYRIDRTRAGPTLVATEARQVR